MSPEKVFAGLCAEQAELYDEARKIAATSTPPVSEPDDVLLAGDPRAWDRDDGDLDPERERARRYPPVPFWALRIARRRAVDWETLDALARAASRAAAAADAAVGRVRPYTRPREVVTFQCAQHPRVAYDRDFCSLAEARAFFEVPSARGRGALRTRDRVRAARERGLTQMEAAATLGLGRRTVQRHWGTGDDDAPGRHEPLRDIQRGLVAPSTQSEHRCEDVNTEEKS